MRVPRPTARRGTLGERLRSAGEGCFFFNGNRNYSLRLFREVVVVARERDAANESLSTGVDEDTDGEDGRGSLDCESFIERLRDLSERVRALIEDDDAVDRHLPARVPLGSGRRRARVNRTQGREAGVVVVGGVEEDRVLEEGVSVGVDGRAIDECAEVGTAGDVDVAAIQKLRLAGQRDAGLIIDGRSRRLGVASEPARGVGGTLDALGVVGNPISG